MSNALPAKSKFFKALFLLSAAVGGMAVAAHYSGVVPVHPHTVWILLYNIVLTAVSFLILGSGLGEGKDSWDFYNHFMGNAAFRLLLSAGLIFLYFYKVKLELISFTVTFFLFYFTYTIFEIRYMLANLRQNSESLGNTDGK